MQPLVTSEGNQPANIKSLEEQSTHYSRLLGVTMSNKFPQYYSMDIKRMLQTHRKTLLWLG